MHGLTPSTAAALACYARQYIDQIHRIYGVTERKAFQVIPLSNPIPLNRERLAHVRQRAEQYRCLEKSDGVRYALLLTISGDGTARAVMVNRAGDCFLIVASAPPPFFINQSLFDGELVFDRVDGSLRYLVFDAVQIGGWSLLFTPAAERMRACADAVPSITTNGFEVVMKTAVPLDRVHELLGVDVAHATDGVILLDAAAPVETYFTQTTFKHKTIQTVDVKVGRDGRLVTRDGCDVRNLTDRPIQASDDIQSLPADAIAELKCQPLECGGLRLELVRLRADKKIANHSRCVRETFELAFDVTLL